MEEIRALIGAVLFLIGSLFLFLGGLGLFRMPDTFNRIQAGTKATTLGTILSIAGIGVLHPGWLLKCTILIVFVLLTNPISSQVLARAIHRSKAVLAQETIADALAEAQASSDTKE